MWNKLLFCALLLIGASCNKDYAPDIDKRVLGAPTAFLLESRYVSRSGNELFIELDIGAVSGRYANDLTTIENTAFPSLFGSNHYLAVQSVEQVILNEERAHSNLILLDLTEGWEDIDPFNLRTMALNKTLQEYFAAENQVGLARYSRNGEYTTPFGTQFWEEGTAFTQSYDDMVKILFNSFYREGGTSSFYDALSSMIDFVALEANTENKNITVITKSVPDNSNTTTYQQVIAKAKAANVRINLISIGNSFNWNMVAIPTQTNGFVQVISTTSNQVLTKGGLLDQGTPMMASIHRALSRNLHVYRVKLKLTRNTGNWASGEKINYQYEFELLQRYADGEIMVNNYIPFYVAIP